MKLSKMLMITGLAVTAGVALAQNYGGTLPSGQGDFIAGGGKAESVFGGPVDDSLMHGYGYRPHYMFNDGRAYRSYYGRRRYGTGRYDHRHWYDGRYDYDY